MPDTLLRDEIWDSDRFLDLVGDTAKLSYLRFLNMADSFGNFEGGRRIFRALSACTQIKTEAEWIAVMDALMGADLLRRYEVEGKEFWHLPRFRARQDYLVQKVPPSPWCATNPVLGKGRRLIKQGLAKNLVPTSDQHGGDDGTTW